MKPIREAWRKIEPEGPTHKGNGSDHDPAPLRTDTDPAIFALGRDAVPNWPSGDVDGFLEQCRSVDWKPDPKKMLFFGTEETVPGKEDFRALRSRLYQLREKMPLKTLVIVSSLPQEGRSFVAANLAQAMARQQDCRVLLLDADLRNPSLHSALGTYQTPGLSHYLLGEADETSIIQRGQMENLFFLPAGRTISGQSEIISGGRLRALFDRLAGLFEWIIVDTPAALPVSDAEIISSLCDGVLMVVRSNSTSFEIVRKAQMRFREEQILGVVLNGIPVDVLAEDHYYRNPSGRSKPNGKWE